MSISFQDPQPRIRFSTNFLEMFTALLAKGNFVTAFSENSANLDPGASTTFTISVPAGYTAGIAEDRTVVDIDHGASWVISFDGVVVAASSDFVQAVEPIPINYLNAGTLIPLTISISITFTNITNSDTVYVAYRVFYGLLTTRLFDSIMDKYFDVVSKALVPEVL